MHAAVCWLLTERLATHTEAGGPGSQPLLTVCVRWLAGCHFNDYGAHHQPRACADDVG